MLSAGTCVEWLRDDLGIIDSAADSADGGRPVRRHRRRVVRPRPARPGHPGVGLRGPRHLRRAHPGHGTARAGAGRARGGGPPGRRPARGGRGRLGAVHRRAPGRRRHVGQRRVRPGPGRRLRSAGRDVAGARGHHPGRRLSGRDGRRHLGGRGRRGRGVGAPPWWSTRRWATRTATGPAGVGSRPGSGPRPPSPSCPPSTSEFRPRAGWPTPAGARRRSFRPSGLGSFVPGPLNRDRGNAECGSVTTLGAGILGTGGYTRGRGTHEHEHRLRNGGSRPGGRRRTRSVHRRGGGHGPEPAQALSEVLLGTPGAVTVAVVAALSGSHLLIEDVPGVGKTVLARALATSLGVQLSRVQGHPDLLPSDITGVTVFSPDTGTWEFRPGPVFAHVVLLDELNRTPPRTQSALLEAMEEQQVSVDGESWPLPRPHLVIGTQNPHRPAGHLPVGREPARPVRAVHRHRLPRRRRPRPASSSTTVVATPSTPSPRWPIPPSGRGPSAPPRRCRWSPPWPSTPWPWSGPPARPGPSAWAPARGPPSR